MATRRLEVEITGDSSSLDKALGRSTQQSKKFSKAVAIGATAAVGGLAVALTSSVKAAVDAERSQKQMEGTLKTLGLSYSKNAKEIENVIQKTSKLAGVDDEELADSFTKLVRATGDVNTALKETQLAADLARGANLSLESATKLIMNAESGRVMGLQKYVGMLDKVTTEQDKVKVAFDAYKEKHKDLTDAEKIHWDTLKDIAIQEDKAATSRNALRVTTEKFAGASQQFGDTTAGSVARAQVAWENFQEKLGTALLPVLNDVLEVGLAVLAWMEKNEKTVRILAAAIGALAGIILTVTIATKAYTAATVAWEAATVAATVAQRLLNAAIAANPVGAIATAVVLLTTAIVVAYKESETFRRIVGDLWEKMKAFGTFITGTFVNGLGKLRDAIDPIVDAFGKIVGALKWLGEHGGGVLGRLAGDASGGMPSAGAVAGVTGGDSTIDRGLWGAVASARSAGLVLTSGYRPGAVTKHGTPSDHGTYPSKAIDVAGPANAMAGYFLSLVGKSWVKQAFYDPLGSIFGGARSGYREGGHSDHVHVATYDDAMRKARWLMPGLNLAYNGTGRPEPVGIAGGYGTPIVNVYVAGSVTSENDLVTRVRDGLNRIGYRNDGTILA